MEANAENGQSPILVAGEPVSELVRAFLEFEMSERADGRYHIDADLGPDVAAPFVRALMRVEAELLLEDADAWGTEQYKDRTPPQRSADALVELITRCGAAVGLEAGKPPR